MVRAVYWGTLVLVAGVAMGAHPGLVMASAMLVAIGILAATDQSRKY